MPGTGPDLYTRDSRLSIWAAGQTHTLESQCASLAAARKLFEPSVQAKVLLVVHAATFAESDTDDAFERTLEVVASVAVDLYERGHTVGLASDGKAANAPALVPVGRNDRQLTAILEMLARLETRTSTDLPRLLRLGGALPWGVTCVYFCFNRAEGARTAHQLFAERRIPVVGVDCNSQAYQCNMAEVPTAMAAPARPVSAEGGGRMKRAISPLLYLCKRRDGAELPLCMHDLCHSSHFPEGISFPEAIGSFLAASLVTLFTDGLGCRS